MNVTSTRVQQDIANYRRQATTRLVDRRIRTPEKLTSWEQIEQECNIRIPDKFRQRPFGLAVLQEFGRYWVASKNNEEFLPIVDSDEFDAKTIKCPAYGNITLFPEQQFTLNQIWKQIKNPAKATAVLQDGRTGSGKTYIAAALCHLILNSFDFDADDEWIFVPTKVSIFTPKAVKIQYERVIHAAGLGHHLSDGTIVIDNYAALYSSRSKHLYKIQYDSVQDREVIKWFPHARSPFVLLDETHVLANENTKQTRAIVALAQQSPRTSFVHFSATPFIKANDTRTFVLGIKRPIWEGREVTETNFKMFAFAHSSDPAKPNTAAIKRLRDTLASNIISTPYVRWPSKQVNSVVKCHFANDRDRALYAAAYARWVATAKKLGKDTNSRFQAWIALGQFSKASEPLRRHFFVEKALANYGKSVATIVATRYKDTIVDTLDTLTQSGLQRKDISIIWGGVEAYDVDNLLPYEEAVRILEAGEIPDDATFRKVEKTMRYYEDRITHGEDSDEQRERHERLRKWGLYGSQSAAARQSEIDRFQSGESKVCLFTCAAGGTGLSLDKNNPTLWDREVYMSPTFNGREAAQAMGRTVRRGTIQPKVYQFMCFLAGTTEETCIMPIMDSKLACISTMNRANLEMAEVWLDAATDNLTVIPTVRQVIDEEADNTIVDNGSEDNEED